MFASLAVVLVAAACAGDGDSPMPTPSGTRAPSTGSDEPVPRDLVDLARRFGGGADLPRQVLLAPPALGDEEEFDLLIVPLDPEERPERTTVSATLRAVSEHAYFFVERDSAVDDAEALAAAIARLSADRELGAGLAAAGRARWRGEFTEDKVVAHWRDLLKRVRA